MGYYTRYEVELYPEEAIERQDIIDYCKDGDYLEAYILNQEGEAWKWYEHEKVLKDMSLVFPDIMIRVSGFGEEKGDWWNKAFFRGEMRKTVCTPPTQVQVFDWSQLIDEGN